MTEEDQDKLVKAINRLTRATQRSYNLGWSILRGIFYSIGWVIGLAVLAVIAYYLLPAIDDKNAIGRFVHAVVNIIRKNQY